MCERGEKQLTERLTEDYFDDMQKITRHYAKSNNVDLNTGGNDFQDIIDKLAEYETAEEEGRLVVLPSNQVWKSQGDIVYYIYDYEITECVNCGISICTDGKAWIGLAADEDIFPYREPIAEFDTDPTDWCKKTTDVLALEWGKTVFLTRGEAEKALKEMKIK